MMLCEMFQGFRGIKNDLQRIGFTVGLIDGYFCKEHVLYELLPAEIGDILFAHKILPFGFNVFFDDIGGVENKAHVFDLRFMIEIADFIVVFS
jgi:hypothetical protein